MMLRGCLLAATVILTMAQAMPGMQTGSAPGNAPPSTQAYQAAMSKMAQGMAITYTGDADKDFVSGMIPHHQGAVDMAQVELKYGRDPQMRKLAQSIVASQTKEIAMMKAWQAKHEN
jgi:uncharacterized protein (DUF305 family)